MIRFREAYSARGSGTHCELALLSAVCLQAGSATAAGVQDAHARAHPPGSDADLAQLAAGMSQLVKIGPTPVNLVAQARHWLKGPRDAPQWGLRFAAVFVLR